MIGDQASELARAFDADFARPVSLHASDAEDLLAIRIGDTGYALARREIGGVFTDKPVTPLPGGAPALLGISGFRGALVPVYDLAALLGAARSDVVRWLATLAIAPVALAFGRFERLIRVPRDAIVMQAGSAKGYAQRAARIDDELRPILDLESIVGVIRSAAQVHRSRMPGEAGP